MIRLQKSCTSCPQIEGRSTKAGTKNSWGVAKLVDHAPDVRLSCYFSSPTADIRLEHFAHFCSHLAKVFTAYLAEIAGT